MNLLGKVATKLAYKLTMTGKQMIIKDLKNKKRIDRAEQKIYDAIALLRKVE